MTTYISMLRGINVSGQKSIKMDALKSVYEGLDFDAVTTYIQSGNVIFKSAKRPQHGLVEEITAAIEARFGYPVTVVLRDQADLARIIRDNPFPARDGIALDKLHVCFLSGSPRQDGLPALPAVTTGNDEFSILGENIYLYCPGGYGKTKLSNTFFEKKLALSATTRNWKTVQKLSELAEHV